jgi:Polyphosphate kinase
MVTRTSFTSDSHITSFITQVFNELESPAEKSLLRELTVSVQNERELLIQTIVTHTLNNSKLYPDEQFANLNLFISLKLGEYEEVVQEAVRGGVSLPLGTHNSTEESTKWNFLKAVFFASTVLTTIGTYIGS